MSSLLKQIKENPFLLAPMAGITDIAFRSFMKKLDASVVTTELVSANGLQYQNERTRRLMRICQEEQPVGIQIFGETLDALSYAAKESEQMGATFVDLNFGCPVNKVVKKGAGSAVLKDLVFFSKILKTVKSSIQIPLTIKIRTGWTNEMKNSPEVCQIAHDEGVTWVAIHGRSRAQGYEGKADWDYIKEVKEQSPVPLIGNGDLTSPKLCLERLSFSGCDAVMIGRGALKNPWIFQESLALFHQKPFKKKKNILSLMEDLNKKYLEHTNERIALLQLKKFSSWFSSGHRDSAKFRQSIFSAKSSTALWGILTEYFEAIEGDLQKDTSNEKFLMGGHG